jgi:2,4-dichlorophenol 6-monooxygenase
MAELEVPVLIVGGGACGLADAIYGVGTPMRNFGKVRWRTSLGGDGALDGRTFFEMDGFGGGGLAEHCLGDSPCLSSNYPQLRLEPLPQRHAEQRAPGRIRFGHELVGLEQDTDGASAVVRDLATGRCDEIRAQYLVGADGGKTVGAMVGVTMDGPTGLLDMVSTHFSADLSRWADESKPCTAPAASPNATRCGGTGAMRTSAPDTRRSTRWSATRPSVSRCSAGPNALPGLSER